MEYKETQPYKLGLIYKRLGELLMNPKTDMRDLAEFGEKIGVKFKLEVVPDEDSLINGE